MRRVIIALLLFAPLLASADILPTGNGNLQLGMEPQYPRPGESVLLTAADYSGGGDSAIYTWSVDGKVVSEGAGLKTFTTVAGTAGTAQTVTVSADGGSASMIVRPADVDLVWEGQTSVPPFYTGRPLGNGGSSYTVLAVPHILEGGNTLPSNALIYTWSENGTAIAGQSGYGHYSVVVTPPRFGEAFTVSVHVETADGRGAAEGTITIPPQAPTAVIYEHAPLAGIQFNKNISGSLPFTGEEASFIAFPLFTGRSDALSSQWTLDGTAFAVDPKKPNDVTFRKVGEGTGNHQVTFSFSAAGNFLETGNAAFTLSL